MKEFEKYVTVHECRDNNPTLTFVDFAYDNNFVSSNMNVFQKYISLTKSDITQINNLLINKIIELSHTKNEIRSKKFKILLDKETDKEQQILTNKQIKTKINIASDIIAVDGRVGPAKNMLISKENMEKYDLYSFCEERKISVLMDDNIEDIILYRCNCLEQPGLVLLYSDDKFELVTLGFHPEKQFYKILL